MQGFVSAQQVDQAVEQQPAVQQTPETQPVEQQLSQPGATEPQLAQPQETQPQAAQPQLEPQTVTLPETGEDVQEPVTDGVARKIGFRLVDWHTIHSDGTQATTDRIATLEEIGCEIGQVNHGDHIDTVYRCATWKAIDIESAEKLKHWNDWLVENEFDTVALNPAANSPMPTVALRHADSKTIHVGSPEQAESIRVTYEMIGCQVSFENHGDHSDAKIRCPEWMTIGLQNGPSAHLWQDWLSKSGFETQHDHTNDAYDAHAGHDHSHDGGDHSHNHEGGHDPADGNETGHEHSHDDHSHEGDAGHNHG